MSENIAAAPRTAIGPVGSSSASMPAVGLGTVAAKALLERAGFKRGLSQSPLSCGC
jgi:hypothetical protein